MAAAGRESRGTKGGGADAKWGFFTNHALVMAYVCAHNDSTVREISDGLGITERATLAMLGDLDRQGIIIRHREGRSNRYSMDFARLALFRRANAGPPTPASFADGLIATLLEISGQAPKSKAPPRAGAETLATQADAQRWGFFTNHLRVLLAIAEDSDRTAREIADAIGVTERAVVAILRQLGDEGIVHREREGRRNSYTLDFDAMESFGRWSSGTWELPRAIVDVSVEGLRELEAASR
jgi:DNA-binding MarR family transcriptional regulator